MMAYNLKRSINLSGNYYNNALTESFFQLLKRERIKKRNYKNRQKAKVVILDNV